MSQKRLFIVTFWRAKSHRWRHFWYPNLTQNLFSCFSSICVPSFSSLGLNPWPHERFFRDPLVKKVKNRFFCKNRVLNGYLQSSTPISTHLWDKPDLTIPNTCRSEHVIMVNFCSATAKIWKHHKIGTLAGSRAQGKGRRYQVTYIFRSGSSRSIDWYIYWWV